MPAQHLQDRHNPPLVRGADLRLVEVQGVLQHLADLWTYDVSLVEVDATENRVLKEYVLHPRGVAAAA